MALRRAVAALLVVLAALALISPSATASTPTYGAKASGSTIKVTNGTVFKISLRTASDGGYTWGLVHGRNSRAFTILSRRVIAPSNHMVGGYSQTVWTVRATHRGTDYIQAVERRSFEKNSVIARFKLTVTVVRH